MKINVFVPATVANLGPGYDVCGLALHLYNQFTVTTAEKFEIIVKNNERNILKTKDNLFYQSFTYLFNKEKKPVPTIKIIMDIQIPQGSGLGSSATAVVGGLMVANAFLGNKYKKEDLLPFAVELEQGKHPDNVAPALLGGLLAVTSSEEKIVHIKVPFPKKIKAVIFTPNFTMDTVESRRLMPSHYPKNDVVFNTSRIALFFAALQTKQYHLFKIAMQDRMHQPTRIKIFPHMQKLIDAALEAGALGSALSGGGSSIIALADKQCKKIGQKIETEAKKNGLVGQWRICTVSNEGSQLHYD